jgi:putative flippase GtrA
MPRAAIPSGAGLRQFIRFGIVGGIGFVVDAGLLHLLLLADFGYYGGRLVSFLAAATTTWILNRSFTFRREGAPAGGPDRAHPAGEWLAYIGLMVVGGLVNYGTYAAAIEASDLVRAHPALGVALGSIAGMALNFWSAKTIIFERKAKP